MAAYCFYCLGYFCLNQNIPGLLLYWAQTDGSFSFHVRLFLSFTLVPHASGEFSNKDLLLDSGKKKKKKQKLMN